MSNVQEKKKLKSSTNDVSELGGKQQISNEEVLRSTGLTTMYVHYSQTRQAWSCSEDECICTELVFGQDYVTKSYCKCDLQRLYFDIVEWEKLTYNRNKWHSFISNRLRETENAFQEIEKEDEGTKINH